ncbi:MAG: hypothetical protein K2L98_02165 [Bacilli bacterium]|nr:hypothetical protein [Bacilli bacterium]
MNSNPENQNTFEDQRSVQAEVIGELRKDKIGKPILVIEIAVLFAIVLVALPIVNKMINDENSTLYKLINGTPSSIISPTPTPGGNSEFADASKNQPLSVSTKMKMDNVVMQNFVTSGNTIKCQIYSYNGVINLDEKEYYLEVYSSSNQLLAAVKLTGSIDIDIKDVELSSSKLNFNSEYTYSAKIVHMKEDDYPSVTISSDESGIGSLTCTLKNSTVEYVFKNNYLISIRDTVTYEVANYSNQEYLNYKRKYDEKAQALGDIASVTEVENGFTFNANINLEDPSFKMPSTVKDYNYYAMDTEAKVVSYSQIGKGYDCK